MLKEFKISCGVVHFWFTIGIFLFFMSAMNSNSPIGMIDFRFVFVVQVILNHFLNRKAICAV